VFHPIVQHRDEIDVSWDGLIGERIPADVSIMKQPQQVGVLVADDTAAQYPACRVQLSKREKWFKIKEGFPPGP
jgi:hypothetical protein